ncbi:restriction endonuclease [Streptacidiphilus sp. MAP5-3]|uniref:restriction endonuclease n=1 Tax=unclassified Streptacidiphilus TaxID=2643834 RepID=UPI0035178993
MARRRGTAAARRRTTRLKALAALGALVSGILLAAHWGTVWPYVTVLVGAAAVGAAGQALWRRDRAARRQDRLWREQDAIAAGHRTLAEVDQMTGTQFEDLVAALCRRDGCTEVVRVGGAGDNGADVRGLLPDGRTMVVQCKRYAPRNAIPAREIRDLMGALQHHRAQVGIFVTTTRFTRPAQDLCRQHGIWALHRDLLGLWNSGTPLTSFPQVNGAGQGDRQHRARWKNTYEK